MANRLGAKPKTPKAAKKQSTKERVAETVKEVVRSNVTRETKAQFLDDCQALHTEFQKAKVAMNEVNGRYRAKLKDAAKNGVDSKAIAWVISARKRDPEELAREINATNEMAVIGKLALGGVQLGLFADGQSVGAKVDQNKIAENTESDEFDLQGTEENGYRAGLAGKSPEDNPNVDGSPAYLRWQAGQRRGQEETQAAFVKNSNGGSAAAAH